MNTIVMNTLTGAVCEYTGFGFQSITPTHAGNASGLFAIGGNTDDGLPIVASIRTAMSTWDTESKKSLSLAWIGVEGAGQFSFQVVTKLATYTYPAIGNTQGQTRAKAGRGIKSNYLAFGFSNPSGQTFTLDFIHIPITLSKNRRTP
jgi:hypothetical protein